MEAQPRIEILLEEVLKQKASDLHLQVGFTAYVAGVDGALKPVSELMLTEESIESLIFAIWTMTKTDFTQRQRI